MKNDSAEVLFPSFLKETLVSNSGMGRDVHSLMFSKISISSTDHGVAHPPRYPEEWFGRDCRDV